MYLLLRSQEGVVPKAFPKGSFEALRLLEPFGPPGP